MSRLPATEDTQCLTNNELGYFLTQYEIPYTIQTPELITVHAVVGDVVWSWMPVLHMFCHSIGIPV